MTGRRQGQGLSEYVIMVGLLAVGLMGAVRVFGDQLRVTVEGSGNPSEQLQNQVVDRIDGVQTE
jgi:hypothetical protein